MSNENKFDLSNMWHLCDNMVAKMPETKSITLGESDQYLSFGDVYIATKTKYNWIRKLWLKIIGIRVVSHEEKLENDKKGG